MAKISLADGVLSGAPRVFIATPTYTGKLDSAYVYALMKSVTEFSEKNIGFSHYVMSYNCHVDDARNAILRDFLKTDCTDLVFIDADVSWRPLDLVRLVMHDRDVVAGVYPKRQANDLEFPVRVGPGVVLQADDDGLVEVDGAPTGFMKIKRHVIEKLVNANKHRQFLGQGEAAGSDPYTIVFERTFTEGQRWSGDYNFCRVWKKMGGKIYVDPEMHLTHVGEVEFQGTLGEYWKRKHGVKDMEVKENFNLAIGNLKAGVCSTEDLKHLVEGWGNPYAATAELLMTCYELAKHTKGPVLETGSGLTTLVMALANPSLKIHCLEHEPIWGSRLKYFLDIYDIKNVTMHFGDLKEYESGKWYDTETLPQDDFSLVLCDGPPRMISDRSILYDRLDAQIKDAVLLMDDADDDEALAPIRDWAQKHKREIKVLGKTRRFAVSKVGEQ